MHTKTLTTADMAGMDRFYRANLVNSLSGFKSVNLVGTISREGQTNLAIFSQVFHLGANPPLVGMIVRPDSVERHTLRNLLETGFFTLNHVRETFYQQAHQTSARYEVSEFGACGFLPQFTEAVPAPYVEESYVKMGLQFEQRTDIPLNGTILIIGRIVEVMLPDDCLGPDGYVDIEKAGTVTGSALDGYHTTQRLARLAYAKPGLPVREVEG
jgi:flavin reductase (DIM6/NTAB) family NADH-FMN oxidoreductase RutF